MELSTLDHLKKALLDTQERIRDCKNYANDIEDEKLKNFFQDCAETEGHQASELQKFIEEAKS